MLFESVGGDQPEREGEVDLRTSGGPVVKTPHSQGQKAQVQSLLGTKIPLRNSEDQKRSPQGEEGDTGVREQGSCAAVNYRLGWLLVQWGRQKPDCSG